MLGDLNLIFVIQISDLNFLNKISRVEQCFH
jgi:hypothetical protein